MSFLNPRSAAEASDSLAGLTSAVLGLAAIVYSVNVIEIFVSQATADLLGRAQLAGGVLMILIYAPLLLFFKSRGGRPPGKPAQNSYLGTLFRQAALTAFSLTLVAMLVLSMLVDRVFEQMSAETAIDLMITFALAIFALAFFVINRLGDAGQAMGGEA
jgi:hypothetical protein